MLDITPLKNAANQLEQSLIYTEGEHVFLQVMKKLHALKLDQWHSMQILI